MKDPHFSQVCVVEGGNPVLEVDKGGEQADPVVGGLVVVLNLQVERA